MQTFWDPVGAIVTDSTFNTQIEKLKKKLAEFQENPKKLGQTRWLLIGLGVLLCGVIIYFLASNPHSKGDLRFLIVPFIPAIIYTIYIRSIQTDLVLYLFAASRNWAYNPEESPEHWAKFAREFPIIFQRGNSGSQFVENEFWGKMEIDGSPFDFWKALFQFTVGSGKHRSRYEKDAMAFHLPRTVNGYLVLSPEGFHLFGEGHDDIKTESVEFNKTFEISCPGMNEAQKQDIVRALSPAVQEKLMDLVKVRGSFALAIKNNVLVICFSKYKNPISKTNFFKKVEIDQRDIDSIQQDFRTILSAVGDMLRYMD